MLECGQNNIVDCEPSHAKTNCNAHHLMHACTHTQTSCAVVSCR